MGNDYYKARLEVYRLIDEKITAKQDFDLNKFIFAITGFYPIGERTVKNRILLLKDIRKDFDIFEGEVLFKVKV